MNIVIYARFSSHSQNEQSIEGQLKTCYDYAERNGYKVIGEYIDRALSGTVADNRPEFQRMIADSAKRQFQAVLVYQLDRFARNRYDSATYKSRLKKYGVRVISARENISDDASGILIEGVLESMAEYYSVELGQKIRRGMALNAEKCLTIGSGMSLGYDTDENKRYVINEEEATAVRKIFDLYINGTNTADIIRHLNANGIKTRYGNPYTKNSLRTVLINRRYMGIYIYKDTEIPGGIPRIIDDETFYRAQEIMAKNKKAPARAKTIDENYLLTTRLYCGDCNAAITGVSGTSHTGAIYQYYQCVTNRRKGGCKKKTVKKAYIEDLVIEETVKILTPETIDSLARSIEECCAKEHNTDNLKRLQKLIRENEKATANLIKALEVGKAADIISAQIEKRQQEKSDLEAQLAMEKIQRPLLKYEDMRFFFERFTKGDPSDIYYRQALVDIFIRRVELFDDHMIIYYNAGDNPKTNVPIDESEKVRLWVDFGGPSGTRTPNPPVMSRMR